MICKKCHVICRDACPICGGKRLRAPEENEPVLLMVLTAMQSMLVEPILQDSGIPFSKMGTLGGALSMYGGMMSETNRFYVPFSAYERSREVIIDVFGEDPEIMRALNEFNPEED